MTPPLPLAFPSLHFPALQLDELLPWFLLLFTSCIRILSTLGFLWQYSFFGPHPSTFPLSPYPLANYT